MTIRAIRNGVESNGPQLLRVAEAAKELACAPKTVWRLISGGELVTVRIGRRGVRISRKSMDDFISKGGIR